ncbi:unnamed protein product [Musa hybrid cultivar]
MSLAIVDKKPQQQRRPGGFVAIFFRLLDWNRRLAKKNLSSRKPLPPVRAAKGSAKRFGADDKMPLAKLLLVDDDNGGCFPSNKNPETEVELGKLMRTPGLVARLMGLESMPVVAQERPRKATDSCCLNSESGSGQVPHRVDQDLCLEDGGSAKLDIRPQKLQKIGGFLERQPLDGGRAKPGVLGKKVLSAPSKNKFHKMASPVKSPRLPSGGHHRSRLIKAATKILEPGLQSKNRAKPAISYKDSSPVDAEGTGVDTTLKNSNEPFRDPVSGTSYGNLGGGTLRSKQREEEPLREKIVSSAFGMSRASCSRTVLVESSSTSLDMQGEQNRNRKTSLQSNTKDLAEMRNRGTNKIKPDGSATIFRRNQFRQNQSAMTRDKVPLGSKVSSRKQGRRDGNVSHGMKGSVFTDSNMGSYSCVKSGYENEGRRRALCDNTLENNMSRKRTINNFNVENVDVFHSVCAKLNVGSRLSNQKGIRRTSNTSLDKKLIKSESKNYNGDDFGFRANDIVSFTFNSPMKHVSRSSTHIKMHENNTKNEHISNGGWNDIIALDAHSKKLTYDRSTTLSGNELSNLLEEKIRELTSVDRSELVARDAWSASYILEELGAACTPEQNDHDHADASSKKGIDLSDFSIPQSKEDRKFGRVAAVMAIDNNQLSPISILEASFSNESCSFLSLNGNSGSKLQFGLTESCNTTRSSDLDTDLLDSASSVDIRRSIIAKIRRLTYMSLNDFAVRSDGVGLSKTKLCEVRHAISSAVLLFETFTLDRSDGSVDMSLESFLLDMLQAIVDALRMGPKSDPGYTGINETDQLRELLFDCMIECLDSNYSCLCKSGYMTYTKLTFLLTREKLMREVHQDIRGWMDLAGKFLDDMVKNEMKTSAGKWADCMMEAFEAGMEIESNILQTLVDETVIDFC